MDINTPLTSIYIYVVDGTQEVIRTEKIVRENGLIEEITLVSELWPVKS